MKEASTLVYDAVILSLSVFFILLFDSNADFNRILGEVSSYVLKNISKIPLTLSFASAIVLTLMYIGSIVTTPIIRALIVPMWVLAAVSYFLPNLIPEGYSLPTLIAFSAVYVATIFLFRRWKKGEKQGKIRLVVREIVQEVDTIDRDSPYRDLILEDAIMKILRKHRVSLR